MEQQRHASHEEQSEANQSPASTQPGTMTAGARATGAEKGAAGGVKGHANLLASRAQARALRRQRTKLGITISAKSIPERVNGNIVSASTAPT